MRERTVVTRNARFFLGNDGDNVYEKRCAVFCGGCCCCFGIVIVATCRPRLLYLLCLYLAASNTADRERSFLFARKNEEKSPFARISREGEKTSKKPPVTRAYLHLTLVSLEQKTSANVITLA